MTFEKLCEIEGIIEDLTNDQDKKINMDKKTMKYKNKSNEKQSKTSKKSKKATEKNSNELTSTEQYCIENGFAKVKSNYYFDFIDPEEMCIELLPNSKKTISIYFGKTDLLEKHKEIVKEQKRKAATEEIKNEGKKTSKKPNEKKSKKSSETSSKNSNENNKNKKQTNSVDSNKRFIAKYNIFLGKTFYRDIIIVAHFT